MLATFILALAVATPENLTVDEIVERHIAARGGAARLKSLRSVVYSRGRYREGHYESKKAFMALARPYFKIVGNPEEPATFREGYDGSTWEWYAAPGVVLRTVGAAAAAGRHNIWVEGPFVDYREKGTTIEHLGHGTVGGRSAVRLRMTLRDGFAREYFVDRQTWLVTAERFAAPVHAFGEIVRTETRVGDYKEIGGVLFPHTYRETEIATGKELSSMEWGLDRGQPRSAGIVVLAAVVHAHAAPGVSGAAVRGAIRCAGAARRKARRPAQRRVPTGLTLTLLRGRLSADNCQSDSPSHILSH